MVYKKYDLKISCHIVTQQSHYLLPPNSLPSLCKELNFICMTVSENCSFAFVFNKQSGAMLNVCIEKTKRCYTAHTTQGTGTSVYHILQQRPSSELCMK